MKRYPSTQALRVLTSFARTGAVEETADELNLTRSAVTYQLRLLERDLSFPLLHRSGTRIGLSSEGLAYAHDVRQALNTIAASAQRYANRSVSGTLTLCSTPGFAGGWLCSRIAKFSEAFPDVKIILQTQTLLENVSKEDVDAFITFGNGHWPEMSVYHLVDIRISPVCSPVFLHQHGVFQDPKDLKSVPLLNILGDETDWEIWLTAAGVDPFLARRGITFHDGNLCFNAAVYSQGVALGDHFTCRAALESGMLVMPFELVLRGRRSYYLVSSPAKAERPTVEAFSSWIKSEIMISHADLEKVEQ
ncbi:MAG: LysR family transcriptional regulator [Mesorhizobium sp.]|uniref:LysR substrate-binding domain-containing protein n=1 Tax=Mesorhizobium sp. TaxID=1871066 RepID=UPI000FE89921|nr:LysR substrate-binding domain-containing protein [Mesorhizobium sp.]RWA79579.1 MAG: LysR family transcriptional regulator [Mesorhizobium sp.]TIU34320.1 MAG: LysR family transcriptional regulator [Mesorhizobium sp.]